MHREIVPLVPHNPRPHDRNYGNTVTIREGFVQASPPKLAAIIDALVATLPGYGSIPFILDEDFNIAQGLIRIAGVGKIVRHDRSSPYRQT